ncbi:MAG: 4-hydroxy-tetrahydrodipicolinate synthase [Planctomycetota bacterium]|jgi:4-hydroxy-tetrahydrodipicolinate synthase|nr:4-hydroxy-tetrahydrodipicolinate synthase [Planctomycetota bacterium]
MFDKNVYGRVLVPMVTPFKDNQEVDYDAAVDVAALLLERGLADSLIITGTSGEFFTMTFDERVKMFRALYDKFNGAIPLIAGTGCASTIEAVALSREAAKIGYKLLMVVAPYYTKPNQDELYQHFKTVAEKTPAQILLYNIPIFTGVNIDPTVVSRLAQIDNIVGIKEEAELNPKQMTAYLNATPDDFIVYNGDDTMILESYVQGSERIGGVVSGGAHLFGKWIMEMIDFLYAGQISKAAAIHRNIFRMNRIMGQNARFNPIPLVKAAMREVGYNAGIPRRPLSPASDEELENIRALMRELGLL